MKQTNILQKVDSFCDQRENEIPEGEKSFLLTLLQFTISDPRWAPIKPLMSILFLFISPNCSSGFFNQDIDSEVKIDLC